MQGERGREAGAGIGVTGPRWVGSLATAARGGRGAGGRGGRGGWGGRGKGKEG